MVSMIFDNIKNNLNFCCLYCKFLFDITYHVGEFTKLNRSFLTANSFSRFHFARENKSKFNAASYFSFNLRFNLIQLFGTELDCKFIHVNNVFVKTCKALSIWRQRLDFLNIIIEKKIYKITKPSHASLHISEFWTTFIELIHQK